MSIEASVPVPAGEPAPVPHEGDRDLVRKILADDPAAWEQFVTQYSGLIHAVARRYLRTRDGDDVQSVFVDVLVALRRGKLRTYEGRASLSTWLTLVTRTEVMDHVRRTFGRSIRSKAMKRLSSQERTLFRSYYIEGRPADEIIAALHRPDDPWSPDRFRAAILNIERQIGDRWLRRLSYDLHAQSIGASSGRLLEYLDHVRDEHQLRSGSFSPEYHLMEREARRTVERLRDTIRGLDPREREMLEMRFERGWSAPRIAAELGLDRPRGVYTVIERIVRGLRRTLRAEGEEGEA